jgi:hypothetical protein
LTDYVDFALRATVVFVVVSFIYLLGAALYDAVAHFDDVEEDEFDDLDEFDETQEPR